jgi:hypothetical protein
MMIDAGVPDIFVRQVGKLFDSRCGSDSAGLDRRQKFEKRSFIHK